MSSRRNELLSVPEDNCAFASALRSPPTTVDMVVMGLGVWAGMLFACGLAWFGRRLGPEKFQAETPPGRGNVPRRRVQSAAENRAPTRSFSAVRLDRPRPVNIA